MAGNQKSIFIRFNMDDKADKELYLKLSEKAGGSSSLTAYVKKTLKAYDGRSRITRSVWENSRRT